MRSSVFTAASAVALVFALAANAQTTSPAKAGCTRTSGTGQPSGNAGSEYAAQKAGSDASVTGTPSGQKAGGGGGGGGGDGPGAYHATPDLTKGSGRLPGAAAAAQPSNKPC